jgi:hypothetical protein
MKRLNHGRFGGAISDALGGIFYFAFFLLTIWGIGWSFYRYGALHGAIAFTVWPYAWYRGVAAIWDSPKWKEDYDMRTEQVALVVENAVNNDPAYQIQSREYIKDLKQWIKSLPPTERNRLHEATRNYALAAGTYIQRYFSGVIEGKDNPQVDLDPAVQQRVEKFKSISGLTNRWQRFVQDSATGLQDLAKQSNDNDARNNLTVGDRAIAQNRLHTYLDAMTAKMESVINELFPD